MKRSGGSSAAVPSGFGGGRGAWRNRLARGAAAGLAALGLSSLLWALSAFDRWEAATWDWRATLLARPGRETQRVCVVLLDQRSLDWGLRENGLSWPWPREVYGLLAEYLARHGALGTGFDVLFTEPSVYGVPDDERFAACLARSRRAALAVALGANETVPSLPPGLAGKGMASPALEPRAAAAFPRFATATLPVPAVAAAATVLANVHTEPDPDGTFRRVFAAGRFDDRFFASLGVACFLAQDPPGQFQGGPGRVQLAGRPLPVDGEGRALLRFRGASGTHPSFSAAAVIQSALRERDGLEPVIKDPGAFRDRYVLFGHSAPGLHDLHPAPTDRALPGAEIHATLLDNFLSGDLMRDAPRWAAVAFAALLALATGAIVSGISSPVALAAMIPAVAGLAVAAALGAYQRGFWLPLVYPLYAGGGALVLALIGNYVAEGRQKLFIKRAFRQYLSPEVIEELLANPSALKLGGERKILSIFFSDLQGFTSVSERLDPEQLTSLLNDYLGAMTDIIIEEGGTVDKYEGDAIIAFWNAPVARADHAARAVRAALRCQAKLAQLRPALRARVGGDLFMRIGVNSGPAVVGNMGSGSRFDYTMLGDAVNLASRLEGANKQFGTGTMVSEATWELVRAQFSGRELGRLVVVGRAAPVRVFEPFLPEEAAARAPLAASFAAGLALYYQGRLGEAGAIFAATAAADPAARAYAARCQRLGVPGADWQGTWVLDSKG